MKLQILSLLIIVLLSAIFTEARIVRQFPAELTKKTPLPKVTSEMLKHLQGPPSEFKEHILPIPSETTISSDSALFSVFLQKVKQEKTSVRILKTKENKVEEFHYEWKGTVSVDTDDHLTISLISKYSGLDLYVKKPKETKYTKITETTANVGVISENFAWGTFPLPTTTFAFQGKSLVQGDWSIMIKSIQHKEIPITNYDHVALLIENRSPIKIKTHLSNYNQRVGEPVGLITKIVYEESSEKSRWSKSTKSSKKKAPKVKSIVSVDMSVRSPNGGVTIVKMTDDGKQMDGLANDGSYGANVIANQEGSYLTQVQFSGVTEDGLKFVRTSQHVFSTVKDSLKMSKKAKYTLKDDLVVIDLSIIEKNKIEIEGKKYKTYAEVWGKTNKGNKVPIAWIGGMSIVVRSNDGYTLPIELNLKWLSKTGEKIKEIELRNVYIQHPSTSVPLVENSLITLSNKKVSSLLTKHIEMTKSAQYTGVVTEDMLVGNRPEKFLAKNKKSGDGVVILSHGYCSSSVPFRSSDFTNSALFLDANQNRLHDEFALLLMEFGNNYPQGFSFVGHSQGGCAALHLLSFYWTNQDLLVDYAAAPKAVGGRLIQSVGTPYNGNSMAGTVAGIGGIIGVGCGSNSDMATNGAKLWMATIPKVARQQVSYYYTQYRDWNWCLFAAQAVLSYPNDGTAEEKYSKLADGQNKGRVKGQCHTTGMKYTAQCLDANRNKEMNDNAAR